MTTTDERAQAVDERMRVLAAIDRYANWTAGLEDGALGDPLITLREVVDRVEAVFARDLGRFEKSGAYKADGALSVADWVRWKGRLSAGAAMERVNIARQLKELPQTEQAFASGDVGYQHVAMIARTAEKVGVAAVQQEETNLLKAAETMDPGKFAGVAKAFEYRVDHEAALAEANRACSRRYLHLSEPKDGLMHLEGLLDAEGGATVKTALEALMPPPAKDDDRTAAQRRADALVELARRPLDGSRLGSTGGQRPHLVITASAETLAGVPGAAPAQLEGVGPIPVETAQRFACDASVSWVLGQAEIESESTHEHRRIPPSTRRALIARDQACVWPGCHRPPQWCDGHHLVWWTRGGRTELANLALVCGRHHRVVHEEGWTLTRKTDRGWTVTPPPKRVAASARSA